MTRDINIKKERRRGMLKMLLIIIAVTFTCCDVHIADVRVWYSPVSQFDDYLRERQEKAQRKAVEAGKRNYERIYREQKEAERKATDRAGEP
jgi:hypothetical protein